MNCHRPIGPRARIGIGLEGALDDGQQRQLQRQAARLHLAHDVVQVGRRAGEHALDVLGIAGEPVGLAVDARIADFAQRQAGADPLAADRLAGPRARAARQVLRASSEASSASASAEARDADGRTSTGTGRGNAWA